MLDQDPIVPTDRITVVWQGIDHVEGLAITNDGVIWCGGELGQVYVGRLDGEPEEIARIPGRTGGFVLDTAGNAYCCTDLGVYRITPDGQVDLVSAGSPDRPAVLPNHPAFLSSSVLLYTDSGNWGANDGCTFAVTPDGVTRVADTSAAAFTNGNTVSPDGSTVCVVESSLPGVSAFSVAPDGSLVDRRVIAEMPGTVPDGVAYDADGRLLIACWAPDAVFLLETSGELRVLAHDPLRFALHEPTNVAFVPGTRTVVSANYGERYLSVFEHESIGAPLPRPEFPWRP